MKTYKTSIGILMLMYFMVALFFGLAGCLVFGIPGVPQFHEDFKALPVNTALTMYAIILLLSLLMIYRLAAYHQKKLILDNGKIYTEGLFEKKRELQFYEIAGFWPQTFHPIEMLPSLATAPSRIRKRNIVVEAIDKNKKNILIPKYLEKQSEILDWLGTHFTNLEAANRKRI